MSLFTTKPSADRRPRSIATKQCAWLLCLAIGCSEDPSGFLYEEQMLEAIDMHLHSGEWSLIPPSTQSYLASNFPFPFSLIPGQLAEQALSADSIVDQLDSAGFKHGVVFAVYAPHSVGITTNDMVLETMSEAPSRLLGMASLRLDNWEEDSETELAALDEALANDNMVGIKLAHAHQHFRMDDPAYYDIYEIAAQHQAPIYLHTGPSPFPGTMGAAPYTDAGYLEDAIEMFPDVQFILGHVGYDFTNKALGTFETCLSLAARYENVYLEPSALGSEGSDPTGENYPEILKRTKEEGLVDRLIYGSDGPQYPGFLSSYAERTRIAMESADYTLEDADMFLSGNFERIFGLSQ